MSSGLWRSPVAHLVRIEGVRGSNPLSSTMAHKALFPPGTGPCVRADRHAGSAVRVNPLWRVLTLFSGPEPRVSPAKRPSPESGAAGHIFTLGHAHRACPDQHDGTPRGCRAHGHLGLLGRRRVRRYGTRIPPRESASSGFGEGGPDHRRTRTAGTQPACLGG